MVLISAWLYPSSAKRLNTCRLTGGRRCNRFSSCSASKRRSASFQSTPPTPGCCSIFSDNSTVSRHLVFPPELVNQGIDLNPPYPGLKRRFGRVTVQVLQYFQVSVVQCRQCIALVAPVAQAYRHQYRETLPVQLVLRFAFALPGSKQEFGCDSHTNKQCGTNINLLRGKQGSGWGEGKN